MAYYLSSQLNDPEMLECQTHLLSQAIILLCAIINYTVLDTKPDFDIYQI